MDNMKDTDRVPQWRERPNQPASRGSFWRILLWIVVLWFVFSYVLQQFTQPNRMSIPYSRFKSLVARDSVSSVTIKGNEISGEFTSELPSSDTAAPQSAFSHFTTTKPEIEDAQLMALLESHNVVVTAEAQESSWFPLFLLSLLPWVLIMGLFLYVSRSMRGQMKNLGGTGLFNFGKSRAKRFKRSKSDVKYADVAGLGNPKKDLEEIVDYLKNPKKFRDLGASIPKGVLLMGPPGTGKTLLARATAGEADVPFYSISGSEFIEMFVGVGASRVRDLFDNAKRESPAIIFIDEMDSIGRTRGIGYGGGHDEREQTLNQILSEMDGFEPHESVVVIGATNRPDVLDPALTRPGRFDRQIVLDLPQKVARHDILKIHSRHVPLAQDVDLELVAAGTVGFSGADLHNLVNEAALLAGRRGRTMVTKDDFSSARDKIMLGAEREELIDEREKRIIAYHEAGHALVARLLPETDPLQKVTIIARGRSLGVTEQVPETERHTFDRLYLLSRICVAVGGRASERLVFTELTNGSANDLKVATSLARKMVCQWGMSERVGPVAFNHGEEHAFLGREMAQPRDFSERTSQIIDEEVRRIVSEMEEKAQGLLETNREKLDAIAEALLEHETLENQDVTRLLEAKGLERHAREKTPEPVLA